MLRPSDVLQFSTDATRLVEDVTVGTVKVVGKGLFAFVHHAREVAFERAAKVEAWRLRRAEALINRAVEINLSRVEGRGD